MFFIINSKQYLSDEELYINTLSDAYSIIKKYPYHATELVLDNYLQQYYKTDLKNLCIKLLLNLTWHKDKSGNLILLFKNYKYDQMARLITYGNGVAPGSKILKHALNI